MSRLHLGWAAHADRLELLTDAEYEVELEREESARWTPSTRGAVRVSHPSGWRR